MEISEVRIYEVSVDLWLRVSEVYEAIEKLGVETYNRMRLPVGLVKRLVKEVVPAERQHAALYELKLTKFRHPPRETREVVQKPRSVRPKMPLRAAIVMHGR